MSTQPFDGASPARAVALTVRFLLELALLAGAAHLTWTVTPGWLRWPAAAASVVVIGVVWGLFLSPKASIRLTPAATLALEAALFIGVGVGLITAAHMSVAAIAGITIWAADRAALWLLQRDTRRR